MSRLNTSFSIADSPNAYGLASRIVRNTNEAIWSIVQITNPLNVDVQISDLVGGLQKPIMGITLDQPCNVRLAFMNRT